MSDHGDPYFGFLEEIKKQAMSVDKDSFLIGKVKSANPLLIDAGVIQLNRNDILISDYLIPGYKRTVLFDLETHEIETTTGLKENDQVLILVSADKQTYVVASKLL